MAPVHGGPPQPPPASNTSAQILAVLLTVAVIGLIFFAVQYFSNRGRAPEAAVAQTTRLEQPAAPQVHPMAKFLEVTGIRFTEERGRRYVRVLVVNHSPANLPDLQMRVSIKGGDRAIVEFPVTLASLGPYESRDVMAEVRIGLKPYEMPDWNMTSASFEITSLP